MADLIWVLVGLIVVSLLLYVVATVVFGPGEPRPPADQPLARVLPQDRPLTGDDVRRADLPVALRGYRMREVDLLLRRVADELDLAVQPAASVEASTSYADPAVQTTSAGDASAPAEGPAAEPAPSADQEPPRDRSADPA